MIKLKFHSKIFNLVKVGHLSRLPSGIASPSCTVQVLKDLSDLVFKSRWVGFLKLPQCLSVWSFSLIPLDYNDHALALHWLFQRWFPKSEVFSLRTSCSLVQNEILVRWILPSPSQLTTEHCLQLTSFLLSFSQRFIVSYFSPLAPFFSASALDLGSILIRLFNR